MLAANLSNAPRKHRDIADSNFRIKVRVCAACRPADRSLTWLVVLGVREGQRRLGDLFGSHMHSPSYQHRGFATDTEEADKIKYPVRTPDSVFVYSGPLALTVSRLKVTDRCALRYCLLHIARC